MGAINHIDISGLKSHPASIMAQQQAQQTRAKEHEIQPPKSESDPHQVATHEDTIHRQSAIHAVKTAPKKQFGYTPIFNWEKQNDETFTIIPTEKSAIPNTITETIPSSKHIRSLFGYKIDLTSQVEQLKSKMQKYFIESKSHNALVGKFSELKFGIMIAMLGLLNVPPESIEALKKDALTKAINENIHCFEENEYNTELLGIFQSKKKDASRIKVLKKLQEQLIKQMNLYGKPNFYTKETIYLIKQKQVTKIQNELLEEHQNLSYIRNFK